MKPYIWQEGMSEKEMRDGAYWERNMLALYLAQHMNKMHLAYLNVQGIEKVELKCGWYLHGEWEGWSRVISIDNGRITFHVPDDFDLGDLPQIEPNWDGHTTKEKWDRLMDICGCGDNERSTSEVAREKVVEVTEEPLVTTTDLLAENISNVYRLIKNNAPTNKSDVVTDEYFKLNQMFERQIELCERINGIL